MTVIFPTPWASSGDMEEVPLDKQTNGSASFEEGFGEDYQKDLCSDPTAKNLERKKLNYILNLLCVNINQLEKIITDAVSNLDASLALIGSPIPWPLADIPVNYLKCNGSSFDPNEYPKLYKVYTNGVLPDLRGEFLRGWDDGRNIDLDRTLLSLQLDSIQDHGHKAMRLRFIGGGSGGWAVPDASMDFTGDYDLINGVSPGNFNGGSARISGETRPRNIAFNFIVRAY